MAIARCAASGRTKPIIRAMMENAERRGLLDKGAPAAVGDACAGTGPDSSVAASATAPAGIEAARPSSSRSPRGGTGASKMRNMVLAALMPFMAVWNSEPRRRMGKKNSCDRNTTKKGARKADGAGRQLQHRHRNARGGAAKSVTGAGTA